MSTPRPIRPLLTTATLLGLFFPLAGSARSQPAPNPPPPSDPPSASPTVTLPSDTRQRQKLEAARDYVKAGAWGDAIRVLQDLLDAKEDQFLPSGAAPVAGKSVVHSGSVRGETLRLLAGLPSKALEAYNGAHGSTARALLKEATERDDLRLLTQVVQRYLYTEAGAEAAERLGSYHLDRGNRDLAGRCFGPLLSRPDAERLSPLTLYKAAVACRLAGDTAREEQAWKFLAARAPDGLTIDGRACDLDHLRAAAARLPVEPPIRGDWPLFRGSVGRTARGDGDVPLLEPQWTVRTVLTNNGADWIDAGLKAQERANRLVLPGFYPIVVPGRVVYRSHSGIHALDPADGHEVWKAAVPLGLDDIAGNTGKAVTAWHWLQALYGDAFHFPIEGSALGCLSTDGERVYALEDLAVPPPAELVQQVLAGLPGAGPLKDALFANRLRAINIDTGASVWEKGGGAPGELQNHFFLGAPLPVAGNLYALIEKEGEVRLVCLDPASGAVAWAQRLGVTPARVIVDPVRRLRGVQMTYAGGLLLCPTDAGAVFAFDPFARSLAWAHLYPSSKQPREATTSVNLGAFNTSWRESAPAVADGKVVFAPHDSDQVHCVSLRDGKPLWQAGQNGSAYLAGAFRDKVLLVGAGGVRALSLKDGREAWVRQLGTPSGQGAASGNVYYLPLKASIETAGPGVAALDIDNGRVLAFAPSRGGEVPGNLTFFRGQVLSQTATTLTAYPQLKARLKHIDDLLAGDPHNARGLIDRGSLRFDQRDVPGGLADLRSALAERLPDEVRREAGTRLHEGLKQALQRDFVACAKYLGDFEATCRLPAPDAERQRREANYLLVLARGRERQGRFAEALAAYAPLYARAGRVPGAWRGEEAGWLPGALPPATPPPEAWVHERVTALLTGAAGEQKSAVEKEVARQWQALPAADLEAVGRFATLFGTAGTVGLQAQLAYAERLATRPGPGRFLEAELHLLALQRQREAPDIAARALETLARLLTQKGQVEDALHYYRQLAEEFGTVPVRDGKTGADFLKELAADRRFLPLLDDPWVGHKYRRTEVRGLFPPPGQMIGMEPEGEAPPCLRRQRLALDIRGAKLKLLDRNTGAELWSHAIGIGNLGRVLPAVPPQGWIPYRADGHLAVVNLGHVACGIDLLERRLLWAREVGEKLVPPVEGFRGLDALNRPVIAYTDGVAQPLGRMSPVRRAGVCLVTRGNGVGLDPLRGDVLWTIPLNDPAPDLFADDVSVYLVEAQPGNMPALRRAVSLRGGGVRPLSVLPIPPGYAPQTVGRNVLVSGAPLGNPNRVALYDPLAVKEVWSRELGPGGLLARSEVPHLTATVERDGKVSVYDLRRREELFKTEVDRDHLRRVSEVRLFADRSHCYLMLNREARGQDGVTRPAAPNAVGGLRCLPAHGQLYAFHRGSGELHWSNEVASQYLILERFEESPLLLFSAALQRAATGPITKATPAPGPVFTVTSIDKRTGKVVWAPKDYVPMTSPVHRVQINPATGTIDLVTRHWTMRHTVE